MKKLESDMEAMHGIRQQEECKKLRKENEQLKTELEHRALKGDFNCTSKILHFVMNPTAIAEQQAEEKQKAMESELEELRAKVSSGDTKNDNAMTSLQAQGDFQRNH